MRRPTGPAKGCAPAVELTTDAADPIRIRLRLPDIHEPVLQGMIALRVVGGLLLTLTMALPAISRPLPELPDPRGPGDGAQPAPAPPPTGPPVPCDSLDIGYNRWARVPAPPSGLAGLGTFAQSPCRFVGGGRDGRVYVSPDAGSSWTPVLDLGGSGAIHGVVTEEAPAGTAFVLSTAGDGEGPGEPSPGLHVTRDFGRSFEAVEDFAGWGVTALAVAPGDPQVMYAAAARELPVPAARGILFKSTDFGNSWTPLPGGIPAAPSRLAVDASDPDVVWANSDPGVRAGAPTGLWVSDNGGLAWRIVEDAEVLDLDTAAIAGATRLDAATPSGILRTRDLGASFSRESAGTRIAALGHEPHLAQVIVAVVDGAASRSIDEGSDFRATPGVPDLSGCRIDLTRDDELTAHFFLVATGCTRAGAWVYRSDGLDVLGAGYFGTPAPGSLAGRRPRVEMEVLREVRIPRPVGNTSGSVAFDGRLLYFTGNTSTNHIYMMTPDGVDAGEIVLPSDIRINSLTYDSTRNSLWLVAPSIGTIRDIAGVYELDLDTGAVRFRFPSPLSADTSLSYDPSLGHFRSYEHHGYGVYEIGMKGRVRRSCEVSGFPADPNVSLNPDRGHPESSAPGFASGIAAGNGNMYLNLEDDRTLYYVSRSCELLVVLEHRRFDESTASGSSSTRYENDQLACDTTTFGRPAIWIRDAGSSTMVAYAVPDGYCPLDTSLEVLPARVIATEDRETFWCARLRIAGTEGTDGLIAGQEIHFYVDSVPIGAATTDVFGLACTTDVFPRGGMTLPVQALFFGNSAYRPARAVGSIVVVPLPRPAPPRPEILVPPPPFPVLQVPPQAPPLAGRPEIPPPQSQPQPQQQVQANAALAAQEQQQPQLAFVNAARRFQSSLADEYAMSSQTQDEGDRLDTLLLAAALMSMVYASLSLARARVRTAWRER